MFALHTVAVHQPVYVYQKYLYRQWYYRENLHGRLYRSQPGNRRIMESKEGVKALRFWMTLRRRKGRLDKK